MEMTFLWRVSQALRITPSQVRGLDVEDVRVVQWGSMLDIEIQKNAERKGKRRRR